MIYFYSLKIIVIIFLGQIVNLLRESREDVQFTNHIVIPASYTSGVTLAMRTSSNHSHELKSVPEL